MRLLNLNFLKTFVILITLQLFNVGNSYGQRITGPTEVSLGQTYTYNIMGVTGMRNTTWFIPYGGEIVSSTGNDAQVKWVYGTSSVVARFSDMYGNEYTVSLPVTQGPTAPVTPPAPIVQSNDCGSTTLSRDSPPTGITYYWQNSANGTNTTNSASTITKTVGNKQYLRAYDSITEVWSLASSTIYTITTPPPIPQELLLTSNICGHTVLIREDFPSGITWYWQDSPTGTSTTDSNKSKTLSSGNKYYLRARNNTSGCWSSAREINYTVNTIPSVPTSPTVTNNCGSTVLTKGSSPSGVTWYWQDSSTGTSTTNSSASITRTSGNIYYLRARNNTTECWSSARSVNYTIKTLPSVPTAPTVTKNCGSTVLTRGTPPSGITWYWQSSSTGTSTTNSSASITRTNGTVYYLRARNNTTGCWSNARTIAYTVNTVPSVPSASRIINNCGSTILTMGHAPDGITYYWQDSPTATIKTNSSSSITRTSGTVYYLRAWNSTSGCWSNARTITYTVNTIPTIPSAPTVTNNCGNTVITRGSSPSGVTWYWQDSSTGTSTANSSASITKTSGNVFYLRARNNTTGCWSGIRTINYNVNTVPPVPKDLLLTSKICGHTVLIREDFPSGITWYWQDSPTGTSTTDSNKNKTLSSGNKYYLRARNNTSGCWSSAREINYTVNTIPSIPTSPTVTNNCESTVLTKGASPSDVTWYWQDSSTGTNTTNSSASITRTNGNRFYLRAQNNTTKCWSSAREINYTVNTIPSVPTAPTVTNNCGSTVLTRGTPPSGITWYWQNSSTGTSTSSSSASITRSNGAVFYLRARNNTTECWSSARSVNYTITPQPIWYADSDDDGYGDSSVTQSACNKPAGYVANDDDYDDTTILITNIAPRYFYKDTDGDGFGDPNDSVYRSVKPSDYVTNNTDQCPNVASSNSNGCPYDDVALSNENYIYTRTYQRAMTTEAGITQNSDVIEQVTYFDGLGRPMQEVAIKASPTGQKDIVRHIGYDASGRQDKDWLPFLATGSIGSYRSTDPVQTTKNYYKTNYSEDFIGVPVANINPYTQKQFEASPLNRVLKQAAPGEDWKLGNGHEIAFDYDTNAGNEVKLFIVTTSVNTFTDSNGNKTTTYRPDLNISAVNNGYYQAGELYKTITYDENHTLGKLHSIEEFTDKQGQVILKRTYAAFDLNGDGDTLDSGEQAVAHDTYYVYDNYGNLTYVLPPKMNATTASLSTINSNLDALGYQYTYDGRNRLVEKQVPGKGIQYVVYNKLDQPILTQDANQRISNEWLFTKYDAFGRIAYTGKATDIRERINVQAEVNAYSGKLWVERVAFTSLGGAPIYYSNHGYPNASSTTGLSEVLTIQYYDNYDFPELLQGQEPSNLESWGVPVNPIVKGLATISQTKVLGTVGDWISSVIAYDDKGRQIWSYSGNSYLKTTTIVATQLDFPGRITGTYTLHQKEGKDDLVTIDTYSYDHMGRLREHLQQIGGYDQPAELIAENTYDDLGQLISKEVGNTTIQPLQTIRYAYNIRGWLKKINDPSNLGTNLFGFEIKYNDITDPTKKLYNGNISQTLWNSKSVNPNPPNNLVSNQYTYSYDALNRIISAIDNTTNYNVSGITYDQNGNIMRLLRKGHTNESATTFGNMDNLTYGYDSGNKLISVTDAVTTPTLMKGEFKDGNKTGNDYDYDDNGNLIQDLNKGIPTGGITYNHLNLPSNITTTTGNISYIYDASGTKLQKTVTEGSSVTSITDYSGNYIYENGDLQFFTHPEGYVNAEGSGYEYVYQYKDHLGNIRLSYTNDPSNPGAPTIIEENNYYPFGLEHKGYNNVVNGTENQWKYQGKEHEEELGLNTYDFGARNYMPDLGRWTTIDPLSEDFYDYSPYNSMLNNPVMFIDPDGRAAMSPIYNTDGDFLGTDDEGLQGKAIVMNEENFTQGMSHDEALSNSLGAEGLSSKEAGTKLLSNYNGLKDRPDYDGFVTVSEGVDWAKSHPGALDNPTAENTLYLDASKLDFGNLSVSNFTTVGSPEPQNLLNAGNLAASIGNEKLRATVYALGRVDMRLNNKATRNVSIMNNSATDYDWNTGGGTIRSTLINAERARTGINDSHGFKTYYYGTGTLNKPKKPFTPQFPIGPKY